MNKDILEIYSLNKSFVTGGKREDFCAEVNTNVIDDLCLSIPAKKISALIGGNGAGKTTLFNIIGGFLSCDSGKIIYSPGIGDTSKSLEGKKPYQITSMGIGRMFQDTHIFRQMTVLENMLIADENRFGELPFVSIIKAGKNRKIEEQRIEKAKNVFSELFGLSNPFWEKPDVPAGTLSFGQQRLLGLARLFMGNYRIVLLDEPTSGVNPKLIAEILEIVKRMVDEKGLSVFLIEHNMKVVMDVADFCNFMSHGRITAFGTPEDVLGNDSVRKEYLGI